MIPFRANKVQLDAAFAFRLLEERIVMSFLVRWLVTAIGVGAAVWIVPGITAMGPDSTVAIIVFALILALVNVSVKPVLQVLSLPISIVTLGIFYLIINALMLELAAFLAEGMFGSGIAIANFPSAFFGSIVISIVSSIANNLIGE